jgi:uncharacterized protein YbbK (DUF523 family)
MKIPQSGITLGISACVKGEQVRFDKGHKKSHFCDEELWQTLYSTKPIVLRWQLVCQFRERP